jgi:hypothetical protein
LRFLRCGVVEELQLCRRRIQRLQQTHVSRQTGSRTRELATCHPGYSPTWPNGHCATLPPPSKGATCRPDEHRNPCLGDKPTQHALLSACRNTLPCPAAAAFTASCSCSVHCSARGAYNAGAPSAAACSAQVVEAAMATAQPSLLAVQLECHVEHGCCPCDKQCNCMPPGSRAIQGGADSALPAVTVQPLLPTAHSQRSYTLVPHASDCFMGQHHQIPPEQP